MKVLITGITGLIGTALAQRLTARGDAVLGISRHGGQNLVVWDVEAGTIDPEPLSGVDAVVHLAGEPIDGRWTKAKKVRILRSRVDSTDLMASTLAGLDAGPEVLVSGSAIGFYGDYRSNPVDESDGIGEGFMADVVHQWEQAAAPAADSGIRVVYARTGIVLDRSGGALKRLALATKAMIGGPLGDGNQIWSWITLSDEVSALVHLIDSELEGPVNLTAPNPVTQREVAAELAALLRRPNFVRAPRWALKAALGELADALIFTSAHIRPTQLIQSGFEFEHPTIDVALRAALSV